MLINDIDEFNKKEQINREEIVRKMHNFENFSLKMQQRMQT